MVAPALALRQATQVESPRGSVPGVHLVPEGALSEGLMTYVEVVVGIS